MSPIRFDLHLDITRATLQPPSDRANVEHVSALVRSEARRMSDVIQTLSNEIIESAKRNKQLTALTRKIRENIFRLGLRACAFDLLAVSALLKEPAPEELLDLYALLDLEQFKMGAWGGFARRYAIGIAAQTIVNRGNLSKYAVRKAIRRGLKTDSPAYVKETTLRRWMESEWWKRELADQIDQLRGARPSSQFVGPVNWSRPSSSKTTDNSDPIPIHELKGTGRDSKTRR